MVAGKFRAVRSLPTITARQLSRADLPEILSSEPTLRVFVFRLRLHNVKEFVQRRAKRRRLLDHA